LWLIPHVDPSLLCRVSVDAYSAFAVNDSRKIGVVSLDKAANQNRQIPDLRRSEHKSAHQPKSDRAYFEIVTLGFFLAVGTGGRPSPSCSLSSAQAVSSFSMPSLIPIRSQSFPSLRSYG